MKNISTNKNVFTTYKNEITTKTSVIINTNCIKMIVIIILKCYRKILDTY